MKLTNRGFEIIQFSDANDAQCSLQQSSSVEPHIWLGCNDANPRQLISGKGWQPVQMPKGYIADTRMHLNKEQVQALVEHLQSWLESQSFDPEKL